MTTTTTDKLIIKKLVHLSFWLRWGKRRNFSVYCVSLLWSIRELCRLGRWGVLTVGPIVQVNLCQVSKHGKHTGLKKESLLKFVYVVLWFSPVYFYVFCLKLVAQRGTFIVFPYNMAADELTPAKLRLSKIIYKAWF